MSADPSQFAAEVASGDERRALRAMRDRLAADMDRAEASYVAQIAARLQSVVERLAELGPEPDELESPSDDIAKRRAARRAASKVDEASA